MFVRDIMTRNPVSIRPDATLRELINLMADKTFEAIPVRSNGKVLGIVTSWDIVTYAPKAGDAGSLDTAKVKEIMSKGVEAVREDEIIEVAASQMFFLRPRRAACG